MSYQNDIPQDIYAHISQFVPLNSQYNFRLAKKMTYQTPNFWKECCQEPSLIEIVDWLFSRTQLPDNNYLQMFGNATLLMAIFKPNNSSNTETLIVGLYPNKKTLYTWKENQHFERTGFTEVNDLNQLRDFLKDAQLILNVSKINIVPSYAAILNWSMIGKILTQRKSCNMYYEQADQCYIRIMANTFATVESTKINNWVDTLAVLSSLLNDTTKRKLERDFRDFFRIYDPTLEFNLYSNEYILNHRKDPPIATPQAFNAWLKSWILKLTPKDLY